MKAILTRAVGGPETLTLETVPDPVPGSGEVLIRVRACGVNFPDALIIEDKYQYRPDRPFSPGAESSGTVEAVGANVAAFKPGDRVIGRATAGGMAELQVLPEANCIAMPDAMSFEDGATLLMTYGTSHYALKLRAGLAPGETLLVLGAAGGVGLAAVELGKAMGARVLAAASSREKLDLALARGAEDGVVYPEGPFDKAGQKDLAGLFKGLCGADGANVIYDPVGGDYAEAALRAIAWEGRFLVVGFPAGIPRIPLNLPLLKSCQIVGVAWGAFATRFPGVNARLVHELLALYAQGTIRPEISERYPLAEAPKAIERLLQRAALGKIVVTLG